MDIDLIFKALANPTRRQILEWLKKPEQFLSSDECGDFKRGVCAGHIERLGNVSQSTMSNHLSVLQQAGLIQVEAIYRTFATFTLIEKSGDRGDYG